MAGVVPAAATQSGYGVRRRWFGSVRTPCEVGHPLSHQTRQQNLGRQRRVSGNLIQG